MTQLCDVAAERGVLGGLCQHGADSYADVADILGTSTFTLDSNQSAFAVVQKGLQDAEPGTRVDLPTFLSVADSLGLSSFFARPREREHLASILRTRVNEQSVRRLAGKIRRLEIARLLDGKLDEARSGLYEVTGEESIDRILSTVEGPIFDLTSLLAGKDNRSTSRLGEGAREFFQHLMDNPREMVGIQTGFPRWCRAIGGGIRPGSLDIIGARAKCGKSFSLDRMAWHVAAQGIPCLNIDTEMSREEHLYRLGAMLTGLPIWDVERGVCGTRTEQREAILKAGDTLEGLPYDYRCVTGEAFEETIAHIRRWVLREVGLDENGKAKPCVVFYDYLKVMSSESLASSRLSEHQALGFVATALKNFAGRYGVGVLAYAQLNRDGVDKEDVTAVALSDRLSWFCSSLTLLKKKDQVELQEETDEGKKYTHKLIPVLCRHGESLPPGDFVNVLCDYSVGKLEEGPTKGELLRKAPSKPRGFLSDDSPVSSETEV